METPNWFLKTYYWLHGQSEAQWRTTKINIGGTMFYFYDLLKKKAISKSAYVDNYQASLYYTINSNKSGNEGSELYELVKTGREIGTIEGWAMNRDTAFLLISTPKGKFFTPAEWLDPSQFTDKAVLTAQKADEEERIRIEESKQDNSPLAWWKKLTEEVRNIILLVFGASILYITYKIFSKKW